MVPTDHDFEALALPHIEDVARFALSLTRDEAEADDLVQETFLRAMKGWHTYKQDLDCRRWLFTICRNAFLRIRKASHRLVYSEEGDLDAMPTVLSHVGVTRAGMGDLFDAIDVAPAIERAVDELPEPHHSIIALVDVQGLSYDEAAQVLEVPIGTVRSRLFRARRMIQETLVEHARDMGLANRPLADDRSETPAKSEEDR